MARCLKNQIKEVEVLFYLCSENKGTDQLHGYRAADLRLFFAYAKIGFLMTWIKVHFQKFQKVPSVPEDQIRCIFDDN